MQRSTRSPYTCTTANTRGTFPRTRWVSWALNSPSLQRVAQLRRPAVATRRDVAPTSRAGGTQARRCHRRTTENLRQMVPAEAVADREPRTGRQTPRSGATPRRVPGHRPGNAPVAYRPRSHAPRERLGHRHPQVRTGTVPQGPGLGIRTDRVS